jgi:hypothetical protein
MNGLIVGLIVSALILIGGIIGVTCEQEDFHKEAILHDSAHYDSVTGKFEWNNEPTGQK